MFQDVGPDENVADVVHDAGVLGRIRVVAVHLDDDRRAGNAVARPRACCGRRSSPRASHLPTNTRVRCMLARRGIGAARRNVGADEGSFAGRARRARRPTSS